MAAVDTTSTQSQTISSERVAGWAVAGLTAGFLVVAGYLTLARFDALRTQEDLALYNQVVWNTLHGRPFFNTMLIFTDHYLGNHFTPIMVAFVPIYAWWPDPRVLLIAQVAVSAATAWPLYRLAREQLARPWAGVLLVAALFLYPPFLYQTLDDFHGVTVATSLVTLAFYGLVTRRNRTLLATLPLLFLLREDLMLIVVMMGIYAFLIQRRYRFGALLSILGGSAFVVLVKGIIPAFRGAGDFFYNQYYDYLGDSPLEIARTLLAEPRRLFAQVLYPQKLELLAKLLAPVVALPLLAPATLLLGASVLAYMLLVDVAFVQVYTLGGQYQALFIPFIFVGVVLGLCRLGEWFGPRLGAGRVTLAGSGLVVAGCLAANVLWGPFTDDDFMQRFQVTQQSESEWELVERIPRDASVMAAERFVGALSSRHSIYRFGEVPASYQPVEYLLFGETPVGYPTHPPALLDDKDGPWQVPRFDVVSRAGQATLVQRAGALTAGPAPTSLIFENTVTLRGTSSFDGPLNAVPGQPLEVATVWESRLPQIPRLVFFVQLIERRNGATHRWSSADRELYGGLFPSNRWKQGDVLGDVFRLDIPRWMPPGDYELHAGTYARDDGRRLWLEDGATTARIGTVRVAPPAPLPNRGAIDVPNETNISLAEGIKLRGYSPILEEYATGDAIDFTIFWRATEQMGSGYKARFILVPEDEDEPAVSWTQPLVDGRFPNTQWQPEVIVGDWIRLMLPADVAPGRYTLLVEIEGEDADPPVKIGNINLNAAR